MIMNKKKIAVIGGGPAGMLAAGHAAELGAEVTLFERNTLLGRKLGITGKGRCNLTNDCSPDEFIKNVTANGKFLFSAINRFTPADTMALLESLGVPLKTERGKRVFPVSDKATDVVLALKHYCLKNGVRIVCDRITELIQNDDDTLSGVRSYKQSYTGFDAVILCTGGVSYPVTGSTGDGYQMAESVGHTITPRIPSLVGLTSDDFICRETMGLSLKNVAISIKDSKKKNKIIYRDFGEMLFCHFGVSGPLILSASAHLRPMENGRYVIGIDLKPALDAAELDRRLLSDFEKYKNRNFANAFDELLPAKLREPFMKLCGIPADKKIHSITAEERHKIGDLLKNLPVTVTGFRPIGEAIVTSGGVSVKEIEPQTMRSKKCPNLYFAGEVMDLDAYTGGFNLQIAFCTAHAAAESAAEADIFE
jgi:predicted Rossmann fold flavoprotein